MKKNNWLKSASFSILQNAKLTILSQHSDTLRTAGRVDSFAVHAESKIDCKIREYRYIARNIPRTGEKMNKKWGGI